MKGKRKKRKAPAKEPKEAKVDLHLHEGLVRVKLQRCLYIPINGKPCRVSTPRNEIVRVSNAVYSEYKGDLKRLGPGKTTAEETKKKRSFMETVISSKNFAVKK